MDNTQQLAALKEAIVGAQGIQAPTSTLGASNAPEIAAMYQSSFQLPQSSGAAGAAANISGDIAAEQRAAAARAAAAAAKKADDMKDPNKYRRVKKDDGGYDFFDPDGNQVDIATLTERTQTSATDWIKDSENPIDIQYQEDFNNLQDYMRAVAGGDKEKAEAYQKSSPELQQFNDRGGLDRLMKQFKQSYQRYYVPRSTDAQAWGASPGGPTVPATQSQGYLGGGATSIGG